MRPVPTLPPPSRKPTRRAPQPPKPPEAAEAAQPAEDPIVAESQRITEAALAGMVTSLKEIGNTPADVTGLTTWGGPSSTPGTAERDQHRHHPVRTRAAMLHRQRLR